MNTIDISYAHMSRLSDDYGIVEHARLAEPRAENGYCVDDVARALVVAVREPEPTRQLLDLTRVYFDFVVDAVAPDGRCHNRCGADRAWQDEPSVEDHWGRALWALGTVAARRPDLAATALARFMIGAQRRSVSARAMAFAAVGASEILRAFPDDRRAREVLIDAAEVIGPPTRRLDWRWPEPRLHYANAVLAEALLAVGALPGRERTRADGLAMLRWLLETETRGDHLSVTPIDGWETGEPRPGFDQQPIEVATLADACARAYRDTGERRWADAIMLCEAWFRGINDIGTPLLDPDSNGCSDGLEPTGSNENQGAEATLALISTQQQARQLARELWGRT
ncbi:glycosyltransferase [Nocardia wallacei]|uniref:glycosyltransferase n=1 Tax=Nocardia wallacei TaxID=480035 RepID=UPI00245885FB|nr:glycosyltransferase [Nocardia wallacei]